MRHHSAVPSRRRDEEVRNPIAYHARLGRRLLTDVLHCSDLAAGSLALQIRQQ